MSGESRAARLSRFLSRDTTGGILLMAAAALALTAANTPLRPVYEGVRDLRVGPALLHLDLTIGQWAADGLLAVFFFVVGLELKHEFAAGRLRDPRAAAMPIAAAVGGVVVPAAIYTILNLRSPDTLGGWAIPAATDIAFAVAVLAVVGRGLPPALRVFLLTLAVVDDLLAISIIAFFYAAGITLGWLALALVPIGAFALAVRRGVRAWWILIPLGVTAWVLVHASGVHATVAGVVLGLSVPATVTSRAFVEHNGHRIALTEQFAERWSVFTAAFAVPVFAFFSAGVAFVGGGFVAALQSPVTVGIIVALVAGKALGVTGGAWLVSRAPGIQLDSSLRWMDVVGVSFVAGIGFTVSLLVGELAFGAGTEVDDFVKIGVLVGSLLAAMIGAVILSIRARRRRSRQRTG